MRKNAKRRVDLANGDLAPKAVLPPPEAPISDHDTNSTVSGPNNASTIHNYAGEFSAHFHRDQPANMDMEFRREPENKAAEMDSQKFLAPPISMPLIKKQRLSERRKGSLKNADKDGLDPKGGEKLDEENPAVDYRHAPKADENVADYKEMHDR
ncbi:hypothetical protein Ddc_09961 [Ditylenchus destructor]|nr:hypothetical protein Ddc_09961 [Ditylenchus destructor]